MHNKRSTKAKQTESLKENIPNQRIEHESNDHSHNRELAQTNGAVKGLARGLLGVQCLVKSEMPYDIFKENKSKKMLPQSTNPSIQPCRTTFFRISWPNAQTHQFRHVEKHCPSAMENARKLQRRVKAQKKHGTENEEHSQRRQNRANPDKKQKQQFTEESSPNTKHEITSSILCMSRRSLTGGIVEIGMHIPGTVIVHIARENG